MGTHYIRLPRPADGADVSVSFQGSASCDWKLHVVPGATFGSDGDDVSPGDTIPFGTLGERTLMITAYLKSKYDPDGTKSARYAYSVTIE